MLSNHRGDLFLQLTPHATAVNVDPAAHMVAGDSNTAFDDAIVGFLLDPLKRSA